MIDFSKVKTIEIPEGVVKTLSINGKVVWKKPEPVDHRFRFKNVSDKENILTLERSDNSHTIKLEASADGVNYTPCDLYKSVKLSPGEVLYLRGNNDIINTEDSINYNLFSATQPIECHGSIMDICDGGTGTTEIKNSYQFRNLFERMTTLLTAPELPATVLADGCYTDMFYKCTSLTTTPELPAMTLVYACYWSMFCGCTSLKTISGLPATTLAQDCYNSMFGGCTSLTTTPELPATTLVASCYEYMFNRCTSLVQVSELPATTLDNNCYCKMFYGCTSLTKIPELPATTLVPGCYDEMFYGCTSLTEIRVRALTWSNEPSRYDVSAKWLVHVPINIFYKPKELITWDGTYIQPKGSIPLNSSNGIPAGCKVVDI